MKRVKIVKESLEILYKENKSIKELSKYFNCSKNTIVRNLEKFNLRKIKSNYIFRDENFFNTIDTEEKAYYLGLIYADGSMSDKLKTMSIFLQEKDGYILDRLSNLIYLDRPLKIKIYSNSNFSNQKYLHITSKILYNDLLNLGIIPNKSNLNYEFDFSKIHIDLQYHFIRGVFDGDGCIYYNNSNKSLIFQITSCTLFLKQIQLIFKTGSIYHRNATNLKNGTLVIGGNKQVLEIFKYLYTNSTLFLERKKQKFVALYGDI